MLSSTISVPQVGKLTGIFLHTGEPGCLIPENICTEPELLWVEKGVLHCVKDGQALSLQSGQLMVLGPGQWYMLYGEPEEAPAFVRLRFSLISGDLSPLYDQIFSSVSAFTDAISREQTTSDGYTEQMTQLLVSLLLLTLCRQSGVALSQRTKDNDIILRAQQYISANARQKLSVPIVAKNTQVSPSYLTALFHKHLFLSPGEYIRRVRLEESRRMIREGSMNFTEIATALQYSTIHHFSRQFKEKFGLTPSEYAKSLR